VARRYRYVGGGGGGFVKFQKFLKLEFVDIILPLMRISEHVGFLEANIGM